MQSNCEIVIRVTTDNDLLLVQVTSMDAGSNSILLSTGVAYLTLIIQKIVKLFTDNRAKDHEDLQHLTGLNINYTKLNQIG